MHPVVRMTLENDMFMDIELYDDVAPISVNNFLKLVDDDFYSGIVFHRIISDFMAQAGGYIVEGNNIDMAKECDSIKGEFKSNGVENNLKHTKGIISMARTSVKDSASSQFFICTASAPHLDGEYAAFGKVINGMDTVDYLNDARTINVGGGLTDFPYPIIRIKKVERI